MALYKRGEVWHYDFALDGRRYRGSTKETILSKARMAEAHYERGEAAKADCSTQDANAC